MTQTKSEHTLYENINRAAMGQRALHELDHPQHGRLLIERMLDYCVSLAKVVNASDEPPASEVMVRLKPLVGYTDKVKEWANHLEYKQEINTHKDAN